MHGEGMAQQVRLSTYRGGVVSTMVRVMLNEKAPISQWLAQQVMLDDGPGG